MQAFISPNRYTLTITLETLFPMKALHTMHKNHSRHLKLAMLFLCASLSALPEAGAQSKFADSLQANPLASKRPQLADAIVAVVNTEVITRQELLERMAMVESRMKQQGMAMPPRAEFQKQLLERMIVDRAQMQLAKEF